MCLASRKTVIVQDMLFVDYRCNSCGDDSTYVCELEPIKTVIGKSKSRFNLNRDLNILAILFEY